MDQGLLRSYLSTIYELPTPQGILRVSLDGEIKSEPGQLHEILTQRFALLTAYNPRSMLLPRRINEQRHHVMRDLLVLGCHRVSQAVGYEDEPDGVWREATWVVVGISREEAIAFGQVFRQNCIVYCDDGRPSLIVTDATLDEVGKAIPAGWRIRT
jgi:hypothetical protein